MKSDLRSVLILSLLALTLLSACDGGAGEPATPEETTRSEWIEYAPQMYHSIPYEPLTQLEYSPYNQHGMTQRHPAWHSVPRGKKGGWPYPYDQRLINDPEKHMTLYEQAAKDLQLPDSMEATPAVLAHGKQLYTVFCDHCHGPKGEGNGPIFSEGKIGAVSYKDPARINLPAGKMYFTITYGKGAMGSHASQLSPEDRWALVRYVRKLQGRQPEAGIEPAAPNQNSAGKDSSGVMAAVQ